MEMLIEDQASQIVPFSYLTTETPVNTTDSTAETLKTSVVEEPIATVIATYLWDIVPPMLLLLGTVGNILTIVIFSRKAFRSTISRYLTVLAVSDTVVLYSGLLRQWLYYLVEYDIRSYHLVTCKLLTWLIYTSLDISAWTIVAVTIERLISVYFPHKVKTFCTTKVCYFVLSFVIVACSLVNGHFLVGLELLEAAVDSYTCATNNADYLTFLEDIWPWMDLCVYSLLPSGLIIVGNALLIRQVFFSNLQSQESMSDKRQQMNRQKKMSSMTTMLIAISILFLICTTPISIHIILSSYLPSPTPEQAAEQGLIWCVENLLMYSGNAINFILYCFSGSRFRKEIAAMLRNSSCGVRLSRYRNNDNVRSKRTSNNHGTNASRIVSKTISTTSIISSSDSVSVVGISFSTLPE
ncbi:FMRFamide receptor [Patella vulgata]|uniref:FMRFamide receptor n=1 Tax=Patella vulgata TaxID=6465 RepID=UPI0021805B7F|nr:FMRFamide receptor [Patella vulgata]